MTRFLTYTRLRIKAVMKVYPSMCVMTLLLCLSLGGMLYMQSSFTEDLTAGDEDARVSIGIVGIATSGYLDTALSMLKNFDPSSEEVRFVPCKNRKSAVKKIRSGELYGAIIIPEGLVSTLLAGETGQMTLLLPASDSGIVVLLIKELSGAVSSILSSMNSGSGVLEEYYHASGTSDPDIIADAQTDLLLASLQNMLHRNRMFRVKYVRNSGQLSIESFYLISMVFLLILLLGIMCAASYVRSDHTLGRLLRVHHLGSGLQVLAEYISLVTLLTAVCVLFIPLIAVALSRMPISFSAFGISGNMLIRGFIKYSPHFLPVILLACSIDIMLYEISPNLITGVLMQFLVMIALAYASGVFYTVQTMPKTLKKISSCLPTGQALKYLQLTAKHENTYAGQLIRFILWTAVFVAVTVLIRRRKLTSKGGA